MKKQSKILSLVLLGLFIGFNNNAYQAYGSAKKDKKQAKKTQRSNTQSHTNTSNSGFNNTNTQFKQQQQKGFSNTSSEFGNPGFNNQGFQQQSTINQPTSLIPANQHNVFMQQLSQQIASYFCNTQGCTSAYQMNNVNLCTIQVKAIALIMSLELITKAMPNTSLQQFFPSNPNYLTHEEFTALKNSIMQQALSDTLSNGFQSIPLTSIGSKIQNNCSFVATKLFGQDTSTTICNNAINLIKQQMDIISASQFNMQQQQNVNFNINQQNPQPTSQPMVQQTQASIPETSEKSSGFNWNKVWDTLSPMVGSIANTATNLIGMQIQNNMIRNNQMQNFTQQLQMQQMQRDAIPTDQKIMNWLTTGTTTGMQPMQQPMMTQPTMNMPMQQPMMNPTMMQQPMVQPTGFGF